MGHHRKARPSRRTAPAHGSHRAADRSAASPAPEEEPGEDRSPVSGLSARDLEDLADAARAARRTGWPFGSEVLSSTDTRRVPTPAPTLPTEPAAAVAPPAPRRFATHQPTEPLPTSAPPDRVAPAGF